MKWEGGVGCDGNRKRPIMADIRSAGQFRVPQVLESIPCPNAGIKYSLYNIDNKRPTIVLSLHDNDPAHIKH